MGAKNDPKGEKKEDSLGETKLQHFTDYCGALVHVPDSHLHREKAASGATCRLPKLPILSSVEQFHIKIAIDQGETRPGPKCRVAANWAEQLEAN